MKFLLLAIFSFSTAAIAAPRADKMVELKGGDGTRTEVELADAEVLEIQLPFADGATPRAVISAQGRIYQGECRVLEVRNEAPTLRVYVQLAATEGDSGWNGCTVSIDPGLGGTSKNLVHVDFGQMILD